MNPKLKRITLAPPLGEYYVWTDGYRIKAWPVGQPLALLDEECVHEVLAEYKHSDLRYAALIVEALIEHLPDAGKVLDDIRQKGTKNECPKRL